ncbi:MAG: hypothetical protein JO166_05215 [Deltaproteobacteria bacterium]|nr:hypothetical protein [Deltaproteobacteria bacterium]
MPLGQKFPQLVIGYSLITRPGVIFPTTRSSARELDEPIACGQVVRCCVRRAWIEIAEQQAEAID